MRTSLILASGSVTRAAMLRAAGLEFEVAAPRVDEATIRESLTAEGAPPRDIADALAELKASRVADAGSGALVLGSDQVLDHEGRTIGKSASPEEACALLGALSGTRHALHSAAVIFEEGRPVWRHVSTVRLQMHALSAAYIEAYVDRNWESIRHSVGGYKIEEEGVCLFQRIEGSHFAILGLPLLELLAYLRLRGVIEG